jgi:hypothetical protein
MSQWLRLAFPIGLGVVAALMNYSATRSRIATGEFVAMNQEIRSGAFVEEQQLKPVRLPLALDGLKQVAVPWPERNALYQRIYTRDLMQNDLVLVQDTEIARNELKENSGEQLIEVALSDKDVRVLHKFLRVGDRIKFAVAPCENVHSGEPRDDSKDGATKQERMRVEYIGPFEVRAVGERVTRTEEESKRGGDRYERIITVAGKCIADDELDAVSSRLYCAAKCLGDEQIVGFKRCVSEEEIAQTTLP